MPRVCPQQCPQQVYISCPNTCPVAPPPTCYNQVPECSEDRQNANNFQNFCNEGSDEEEEPPRRERKHRRSSNETPPPPKEMEAPVEPQKSGFCSCDGTAMLIILAHLLAVAILTLAIWCYIQDSMWNEIVHRRTAFPNLEGEDFIGGHYLYLYEDASAHLQMAKKFMLRENRWLELMHMAFFAGFIVLTSIQLATYLTRGKEDHSRVVICYYSIFGGLGIIVALFPMLSWNQQDAYYDITAKSLRAFSNELHANPTAGLEYGVTNATGYDARTIARILKFCSTTSQDGITIDENTQSLKLFKRDYTLKEFQTLGFCTHHKFKIANTMLSFIFAFVCCAIPCVYCFGDKDDGFTKPASKRPPPSVEPLPTQPPMGAPRDRKRSAEEQVDDVDELRKFRRYVEAGTDEEKTFDDHHHFK